MKEQTKAAIERTRFDETIKGFSQRLGNRRTLLAGLLLLGGATAGLRPPATDARRRRKRAFQCPGPTEDTFGIGSDGSRARLAQVFTASRTGSLRQIKIAVVKKPNPGSDYVVQLVKVSGSPNGTPSNSAADVLAEVTIPDGNVPAGASTLTGSFSGPKLVQGTEYAAVINRLGNTELTVGTRVGANGADDCPNSRMFSATGDNAFEEVFIQDMIVSVLVA